MAEYTTCVPLHGIFLDIGLQVAQGKKLQERLAKKREEREAQLAREGADPATILVSLAHDRVESYGTSLSPCECYSL